MSLKNGVAPLKVELFLLRSLICLIKLHKTMTTFTSMIKMGIYFFNDEELNQVLLVFVDTIYSYDTKQKKFFGGTDKYMTEKEYQNFRPITELNSESEVEKEPKPIISSLLQAGAAQCRKQDGGTV